MGKNNTDEKSNLLDVLECVETTVQGLRSSAAVEVWVHLLEVEEALLQLAVIRALRLFHKSGLFGSEILVSVLLELEQAAQEQK